MSALYQSIKTSLNYFLLGILALLPLVVVVQIFFWLADFFVAKLFDIQGWMQSRWMAAAVFAAIYALLAYIGYELTKHRQSLILTILDVIIERLPFLNTVYRVTKKIVDMLRGRGDERAREVVYVEYPKEGIWVPAYVTNREGEYYVLFIPTSPNPTSGFTVIVHESNVIKSALNFEDVSSFIVSVGADFPKPHEVNQLR